LKIRGFKKNGKIYFWKLTKNCSFIFDEKYIENTFGFDTIYIEFGLDLETHSIKRIWKKNKKKKTSPLSFLAEGPLFFMPGPLLSSLPAQLPPLLPTFQLRVV